MIKAMSSNDQTYSTSTSDLERLAAANMSGNKRSSPSAMPLHDLSSTIFFRSKKMKMISEAKKMTHRSLLSDPSKNSYLNSFQAFQAKGGAQPIHGNLLGHFRQQHFLDLEGQLKPPEGIFNLAQSSNRCKSNFQGQSATSSNAIKLKSETLRLLDYTHKLGGPTQVPNTASCSLSLEQQQQNTAAVRAGVAAMSTLDPFDCFLLRKQELYQNAIRENLIRENAILKEAVLSRNAIAPTLQMPQTPLSTMEAMKHTSRQQLNLFATLDTTEQQKNTTLATGTHNSATLQLCLPARLAIPDDNNKLSNHQILLRHQIEAFKATEEDISTHTRGRNKPIMLGQVGIRCRHCAHIPVVRREKGSTYFPASLKGLYQAAQNMSTTHMQSGLCNGMPLGLKHQFISFMSSKVTSSGVGRPYWAEAAKKLGLVDTEEGIRFIKDMV